MENIRPFKIADTVNVYPQALNRDCCDKNDQSGARKHWDLKLYPNREG